MSVNVTLNRSLQRHLDRQTVILAAIEALDRNTLRGSHRLRLMSFINPSSNLSYCANMPAQRVSALFNSIRQATNHRIHQLNPSESGLRLARLQRRLTRLEAFERHLRANPRFEVFCMGWGSGCAIQVPKRHNLGQFDTFLMRDRATRELSVFDLETSLLSDKSDLPMPILSPIAKLIVSPKTDQRMHRSRLPVVRLFKSQKNNSGPHADTIGCCTQVSLDELASAFAGTDQGQDMQITQHSDQVHHPKLHQHGEGHWVEVPQSGFDIGLAAGVGYVSLAGAYIGLKTIRPHHVKLISELRDTLKKSYKELNYISVQQGLEEKVLNLKAKIQFCQQQVQASRFQLYAAGYLSGIASLTMFLGQFIPPFQFLALAKNTLVGFVHGWHSAGVGLGLYRDQIRLAIQNNRLAMQNNKEDVSSQKAIQIAMQFITKKINTTLKNIFAWWGLFTPGVLMVTLAMVSMMGVPFGVPTPLLFVGLALLIPGILGTSRYNNQLTSNQFTPGLPLKVAKNNLSRGGIEERLRFADKLSTEVKLLKVQAKKQQSWQESFYHESQRLIRYRVWVLASLGILSERFMGQKSHVKGIRARSATLSKTAVLDRLQRFTTQRPDPYDFYEKKCLALLGDSELTSQFAKLVAQLAWVKRPGAQGYGLSEKFAPLFDQVDDKDTLFATLKILRPAKPCCAFPIQSKDLLAQISFSTLHHRRLFSELVNRFLLFQAPKDAGRELALYSTYLACFYAVDSKASMGSAG